MAVSQECPRLGAKDGALHLQRDEACLQIRCQVGILERESNGREACRIAARLNEANEQPVQLTPAWFFLLLTKLPLRERLAVAFSGWLGPRISEAFGLKWQDLDLDDGVVSFRRGFVQGRITLLKTEASRTNLPLPEDVLDLLRQWRSITPHPTEDDWVFASPYTKGERPFWPAQLLKTHIKPVALKAGLPSIGWHSFRHTASAWGKEAGLQLEDVKTLLRHENIATTSDIYGDLGLEAKRRIQQRLINFVKEQVPGFPPLFSKRT
jgi:integrase